MMYFIVENNNSQKHADAPFTAKIVIVWEDFLYYFHALKTDFHRLHYVIFFEICVNNFSSPRTDKFIIPSGIVCKFTHHHVEVIQSQERKLLQFSTNCSVLLAFDIHPNACSTFRNWLRMPRNSIIQYPTIFENACNVSFSSTTSRFLAPECRSFEWKCQFSLCFHIFTFKGFKLSSILSSYSTILKLCVDFVKWGARTAKIIKSLNNFWSYK